MPVLVRWGLRIGEFLFEIGGCVPPCCFVLSSGYSAESSSNPFGRALGGAGVGRALKRLQDRTGVKFM